MTEKSRGKRIQERRLALGINSERRFARATATKSQPKGMARKTISNAEAGKAADATYLVLEALLDRLESGEQALPDDEPTEAEPGVFLFEIEGEGVRVVAHIPDTGNPEDLRASVAAIIQGMEERRRHHHDAATTMNDGAPVGNPHKD